MIREVREWASLLIRGIRAVFTFLMAVRLSTMAISWNRLDRKLFPEDLFGAALADGVVPSDDATFNDVRLPQLKIQFHRFVAMIPVNPKKSYGLVPTPDRLL